LREVYVQVVAALCCGKAETEEEGSEEGEEKHCGCVYFESRVRDIGMVMILGGEWGATVFSSSSCLKYSLGVYITAMPILPVGL
jgi:hypothetical protein